MKWQPRLAWNGQPMTAPIDHRQLAVNVNSIDTGRSFVARPLRSAAEIKRPSAVTVHGRDGLAQKWSQQRSLPASILDGRLCIFLAFLILSD
jgi:hypothetical protein